MPVHIELLNHILSDHRGVLKSKDPVELRRGLIPLGENGKSTLVDWLSIALVVLQVGVKRARIMVVVSVHIDHREAFFIVDDMGFSHEIGLPLAELESGVSAFKSVVGIHFREVSQSGQASSQSEVGEQANSSRRVNLLVPGDTHLRQHDLTGPILNILYE